MNKIKQFIGAFKSLPKLFRLVWRTDKRYLIYMVAETVCFALMPYPPILLVKYTFDALEKGIPYLKFAILSVGLIALGFCVALLKSYFNSVRPGRNSLVVGKLYNEFHRKSMEMDYELLAEKKTQEIKALAGNFVGKRLGNTVWNFVWLFSGVLALCISCSLLGYAKPWLILLILAGMVLDGGISTLFVSASAELGRKIQLIDRRISYFEKTATDTFGAKDIRIFGLAKPMKARNDEYIEQKFSIERKRCRLSNLQGACSFLLSYGIDFAVYIALGYLVLRGELPLGSFALTVGNIAVFRENFKKISSVLSSYAETAGYVESYEAFMSIESKFRNTGHLTVDIDSGDFSIEFRDVSFKYPGQSDFVLHHFNLKVNRGEKIAVVGENGAGKSTLVKLLMRLYDPTEGEIYLNGQDIKEYLYDEYLDIFAPVFQDFKLFAFTVGENISSFGEMEPSKIANAAKLSGIDGRISESPEGYDTYITKRFDEAGVEFSGGELQKIALARTYYKSDALITIMDEPTSMMDPRAERELYSQLNRFIGSNTAFFISHRLASAKFCDKIIVVKDGAVFESGTHAQLMAAGGYYSSVFALQSSYYE